MEKATRDRYRAMPRCIGQYELGHIVCDGGPGRVECNYRSTCTTLKKHTINKKTKSSDYVILEKDSNGNVYAKPLGLERFVRIVEGRGFEVEPENVVVRSPALRRMSKKSKGKRKRKNEQKKLSPWHGNFLLLDEWFKEWLRMVSVGVGLPVARLAIEARPGELYFRDYRMNPRSEVSIFIRGKPQGKQHGIDFPIAELRWQTKKLRMTVAYSIFPEQFVGIKKDRMSWLKPQKINLTPGLNKVKRKFVSRSVDLTRAQLRMSAEVIVDLMNWDLFKVKEFLESIK